MKKQKVVRTYPKGWTHPTPNRQFTKRNESRILCCNV